MIRDSYPESPYRDRQSLSASPIFVCTALAGLILFTLWFLGTKAYHFTDLQMVEFLVSRLEHLDQNGRALLNFFGHPRKQVEILIFLR